MQTLNHFFGFASSLGRLAASSLPGVVLALGATFAAPSASKALVIGDGTAASGNTLTFDYDREIKQNLNQDEILQPSKWLTAKITTIFNQSSLANGVTIFLTASLPRTQQFIDDIRFNISPNLAAAPSYSDCTSSVAGLCDAAIYNYAPNNAEINSAGGIVGFDFATGFPNSGGSGAARLDGTNTFSVTLTAAGLSADDFLFTNEPQSSGNLRSDVCTAAKVNGGQGPTPIIGTLCNGTTRVPGPLPILGAAAAFGYSRRIRTRIQSARQQRPIS